MSVPRRFSGYGWILVATRKEFVKFNVGVGVWLDEYQKGNQYKYYSVV
jgi:hypothetical protein